MPDASAAPLTLIVGGDRLALTVCDGLMAFESQDVAIVWDDAGESFVARVDACGATLVHGKPNEESVLRRAGVERAFSIMLLSGDDHLNLETALKARDLNPGIRVVMRQFNRTLGQKIELKLENCSVVSLASQSAATYATVAVDRSCHYGVQFPDFIGPLFGFANRSVTELDLAETTIEEAERRLDQRVLAVGGELVTDRSRVLRRGETFETFGAVRAAGGAAKSRARDAGAREPLVPRVARRLFRLLWRADPLARSAALAAFAIFVFASIYFSRTLAIDPLTSAYFVMATMTTTGYGDIVPHSTDHAEQVASMVTMGSGVVFTALFVAVLTTRFTQAQFTLQQGLRKISRRGHIVVCGAGNVGTRVIDFLVKLGLQVVVIEARPGSSIVERSRDREFDLLTGDATADSTLALCNLAEADALIALTESDTMNLEVALGAGQINPDLPVVMRVQEATFARSVEDHFGLKRAYSTSGLAAPVFAGLSRARGVRGFVRIAGREFGVSEAGLDPVDPVHEPKRIPLMVWRDGKAMLIHSRAQAEDGDRVLTLFPAYQFLKAPTILAERSSEPQSRPRPGMPIASGARDVGG